MPKKEPITESTRKQVQTIVDLVESLCKSLTTHADLGFLERIMTELEWDVHQAFLAVVEGSNGELCEYYKGRRDLGFEGTRKRVMEAEILE